MKTLGIDNENDNIYCDIHTPAQAETKASQTGDAVAFSKLAAAHDVTLAHAERLAEALKIVANSGWLVELPQKAQAIVHEALAQWEQQ